MLKMNFASQTLAGTLAILCVLTISPIVQAANPIITHKYTADPAALVYNGVVYLYAGHDQCPPDRDRYQMHEWLVFSSTDMVNWTEHPVPLRPKDFAWAKDDAWASQVIERNGKFYWYVSTTHKDIHGKAIGVAVSDSPIGPFKDARGSALITNDMTTDTAISWDDIDPTVFIDDDGEAYLLWGNSKCRYIKLKENMIEPDGPIHTIPDEDLAAFEEAPWVHKRNGIYYLSYATGFPERTAYATASKITGPWTYRGLLAEGAGNCNTIHQAIISFKGKDYFFYHTGMMQRPMIGGSARRAVCVDYLYYNSDGTIKKVIQTSEGISPVQ